jgi:hypothetical protein
LRYYYRFGLRSLRTISHIRSLRRHFNLSEVILLIFYLPLPLHTENNIVLRSLALRKTSYRFDLTHTAFYCVPRLYTAYIDLDTLRSTSFYCVLSISLRFSSRFIGFALISLDLLLHTSDYVYGHTLTLTLIYPITFDQDIHPFIPSPFFKSVT